MLRGAPLELSPAPSVGGHYQSGHYSTLRRASSVRITSWNLRPSSRLAFRAFHTRHYRMYVHIFPDRPDGWDVG